MGLISKILKEIKNISSNKIKIESLKRETKINPIWINNHKIYRTTTKTTQYYYNNKIIPQ